MTTQHARTVRATALKPTQSLLTPPPNPREGDRPIHPHQEICVLLFLWRRSTYKGTQEKGLRLSSSIALNTACTWKNHCYRRRAAKWSWRALQSDALPRQDKREPCEQENQTVRNTTPLQVISKRKFEAVNNNGKCFFLRRVCPALLSLRLPTHRHTLPVVPIPKRMSPSHDEPEPCLALSSTIAPAGLATPSISLR